MKFLFFKKIIIFFTILLISTISYAGGWAVYEKNIRLINVESGYVRVYFDSSIPISNPDGCQNASLIAFNGNDYNKQRMYSALMSAHLAKKPVLVWVHGCVEGWGTNFPQIISVYVGS